MKKAFIVSACLAGALSLAAYAAEEAKPAMPPGHPDVSGNKAALPPGHPAMPAAEGAMPAGHPAVPGAEGGALPSGHPSMESLRAAATQPFTAASVKVRAIQGTKKGPSLAGSQVTVEFYGQGSKVLKTVQAKLNDKNEASVEGPADLCQPVVRIDHSGISYEGVGDVMDRGHRSQDVEMTVYETTDQKPDWSASMQHVLVHMGPEGLHVIEMLAINNTSDRTWVGTGAERHTLALPLTPGATNVAAPQMPDGALHFHDGTVLSGLPLQPGRSEFQVEYTVPLKDGKADLMVTAPATVGQMYVFIPDDGSTVNTDGLQSMGVRETGEGNKRAYKAGPLKAGQVVKLSFSNVKPTTAPVRKAAATSSRLPQIAAGVGGGLVLLGGVTYVLLKAPRKNA